MNPRHFYSNGKFLISGEYLVLKGATSLALPLKYGQGIQIVPNETNDFQLHWKTWIKDQLWIDSTFDIDTLELIESNSISDSTHLQQILKAANKLNPAFLKTSKGLDVLSTINFDIGWGLGSSSSLTANVARMFDVNPFDLHFQSSAGSGYDIACASASGSILYTLKANNIPVVKNVDFHPDFKNELYFVYLGQKQRSHQSIRDFHSRLVSRKSEIRRVSEISQELLATHDLEEFEFFLNELEQIMSGVLDLPTVKDKLFADFPGTVKSLGAWGGDFVMMTWQEDFEKLKQYLKTKNLDVVFRYDHLVLV